MFESMFVAQVADGGLAPLIWLGLLVVLFYFLLIRPQRVRARRHQELVASLAVGDRIQTIGGIHGSIRTLDGDSAVIEVEDGGTLRISRQAISGKRSEG